MEFALNFAWALLALSAITMWLRTTPVRGQDRRREFLALAVCLLILFPVISVTDDLQIPANPAEADCCVRRDFVAPDSHSVLPMVNGLPEPTFSGLVTGSPRLAAQGPVAYPSLDSPGLPLIQNRPPPAA